MGLALDFEPFLFMMLGAVPILARIWFENDNICRI